jgi:hypothetical protein
MDQIGQGNPAPTWWVQYFSRKERQARQEVFFHTVSIYSLRSLRLCESKFRANHIATPKIHRLILVNLDTSTFMETLFDKIVSTKRDD